MEFVSISGLESSLLYLNFVTKRCCLLSCEPGLIISLIIFYFLWNQRKTISIGFHQDILLLITITLWYWWISDYWSIIVLKKGNNPLYVSALLIIKCFSVLESPSPDLILRLTKFKDKRVLLLFTDMSSKHCITPLVLPIEYQFIFDYFLYIPESLHWGNQRKNCLFLEISTSFPSLTQFLSNVSSGINWFAIYMYNGRGTSLSRLHILQTTETVILFGGMILLPG